MKRTSFMFSVICIGVLFIMSCSSPKIKQDPYFERWKRLAEQNMGSSPKAILRTVDIEQGLENKKIHQKMKEKNKLPTQLVTLKLRNADIKAIIHALAKAANQNIVTTSNIKGKMDVDIKKQPWNEVFKALLISAGLTYYFEGDIIRVLSKEDLNADLALEKMETQKEVQEQAKRQLSPLITKVIKINFADAKSLRNILVQLLTRGKGGKQRGNILVDTHTNSLVVQAVASDMKKIVNLLNKLDRPTDQIHLKAYIVEANRNVARELGIQWGGKWINSINGGKNQISVQGPVSKTGDTFGTGTSNSPFGINFPISSISSPSTSSKGAGLNILIGDPGANILELQLSALEEKGQIHILSSPSLTTLDNNMAFTESGEKIPYVTIDEDGNREVEFQDAVLRLEMTPHVINDKYLKMEVKVKKDEVDFSKTVDGNPTILKKETQTSLVVRNGETIVISGLTKQTIRDVTSGIPGLKDIPGLGYLFKGSNRSKEFEDILIFITPTILKKKQDLAKDMYYSKIGPYDLMNTLKRTQDPRAIDWLKKSQKFLQEKNWDEALRCSSIAIDLDPGLARAYLNHAIAYFKKGKEQKAILDLNKAIFLDPKLGMAYNLKGEVLEKIGYKEKAVKFYEKGCALNSRQACENHKRLFYKLEK